MSTAALRLCRHWVDADRCFKCKEDDVLRGIATQLRALFKGKWSAKRGESHCVGGVHEWTAATLVKACKILDCKPSELYITVDFEGVDEEAVLFLEVRRT